MKRIAAGAAVCAVLLAWTATIEATQVIHRTPQQMGSESGLVVLGKVSSVRSYWNESGTKILTETVITVEETYKGRGAPTARIVQLGGVAGNVRMHVHGALSWRPDEEVVLFLDPMGDGAHRVAGFSQGKFDVERDPRTGKAFVAHPALEGVDVIGAPGTGGQVVAPRAEKMPLDEFVNHALGRR